MSEPIWLITSGDYSDYTVHAVVRTEADASEVCRRANALHLGASSEMWEVSESVLVEPDDVTLVYTESAAMDGSRRAWNKVEVTVTQKDERVQDWPWGSTGRATSRERALKIAQDRAAKRRAEALGL
jgi:hypothetical protein